MAKLEENIRRQNLLEASFFGIEQPYEAILNTMHAMHEQVAQGYLDNQLMLLEHAPVITITRQHMLKSVKTSKDQMQKCGIDLVVADRGGDVTFHGPGQLVGYPLLHVEKNVSQDGAFFNIAVFIRSLEQALLMAIRSMGITSVVTVPGFTGIWSKNTGPDGRVFLQKLVAIGVGIKDGVSKHGFAMNIDIDFERYREHIIPCGLKDRGIVTLKEVFFRERLALPAYSEIVKIVAESVAHSFSLTLKWRNAWTKSIN